MKNLFRNIFLVSCLLLTVGAVEAQAQSNATELQAYLQQLEVDKVQYKNNPARYQEYENKIANIKKELGISTTAEPAPNNVATQPQETEQARMARTLSVEEYDKWKIAQSPKKADVLQNQTKSARVMPAPTKLQKQNLGGVQITTHQNGQTTAPRQRLSDGAKKEMSAAKKAIYQKYGLQTNISKQEMIQWRKDNPEKWQSMRQDLRTPIANQNQK